MTLAAYSILLILTCGILKGMDLLLLLLEGCGLASFLAVPLACVVENRWNHYRKQQQAKRWALEAHSITVEVQDDGDYQVVER